MTSNRHAYLIAEEYDGDVQPVAIYRKFGPTAPVERLQADSRGNLRWVEAESGTGLYPLEVAGSSPRPVPSFLDRHLPRLGDGSGSHTPEGAKAARPAPPSQQSLDYALGRLPPAGTVKQVAEAAPADPRATWKTAFARAPKGGESEAVWQRAFRTERPAHLP